MQAESTRTERVAVIGAGIIGISTAIRILQSVPGSRVTVFTERSSPNTTGDVAAGFWTPIYLSDTPASLSDPWSKETYDYLCSEHSANPNPLSNGVFFCPGFELHTADRPPPKSWSHIPIGFRELTSSELQQMFGSRYRSGYYYVAVMAEGKKYIPYLMERFYKLGGQLVVNKRIESFNELFDLGFDSVVNCSGIGARQLCNDDSVTPIRGQVLRVSAPWMNFWLVDDTGAYCLPNSDTVVVGGVTQRGNWDLSVSEADRSDILRRVYALWPALKTATVLADCVGLRPGRPCVRLEKELLIGGKVVYHNYGHGGAGLSLFWGCAGEIVNLMKAHIAGRAAKL